MKLTNPLGRSTAPKAWTNHIGFLAAGALGAGVGAGLMYWLDPHRGKARRARIESEIRGAARRFEDRVEKRMQDADNRLKGTLAEARRYVAHEEGTPDEILIQRVRAALGHATRHAHAITVEARDGHVTLRGSALEDEAKGIVAAVRSVADVREVENRMALYDSLESHLEAR